MRNNKSKNKSLITRFDTFVNERYESSDSYIDDMDQDEFDAKMSKISKYEEDMKDRDSIEEYEMEIDTLTPEDVYSNNPGRERETQTPVKDPVTSPGIRPMRPSSPSPIRRDRPSVDPAPKALKKATINDLVKKVMDLRDGE